ncbi:hypothetical protein EG68_00846 [Paragonimus skrjabini miyazakii]|uniref:G-protein coupled receptors family 1 profile domain-containing protein n=1 Tax=Paragonimus skrjabini miyazakii TaxID=59628 RepID=A0A8S9Z7Y2_9TREM|nr:hypothetical protein EG68_00846 [Paragonimus skrjabini miyazakii]
MPTSDIYKGMTLILDSVDLDNLTGYSLDYSKVDPNNSMPSIDRDVISYYLMGVCTMCICCFGAIGNILSLIVLTKRAVGSPTTNIYLISLAIADLMVMFATILTAIKDTRRPQKGQLTMLVWQDTPLIPKAYPYFHSTAILFQVTSVWLTVAFTSDRYLMICHPFLAKRWCTISLARLIIIAVYIASLLYSIPRYFEYQEFEVYLPSNIQLDQNNQNRSTLNHTQVSNQSMHLRRIVWYDLSEFGSSKKFMHIYHLWSWNILVVALPFIMIVVMNSFLICEVRKSSSRNAKLHYHPTSRRHDTDVMLIGVIVVFLICQTPAAISHFSWGLIPLDDTKKMPWYLLNEIGNLLVVINSAINLVLYYLFSRRFRRHFIQLFCPYRLIHDNGYHCVYVPRWIVDNWDNELSDHAGSIFEAGLPPINHTLNARLAAYHRRQSFVGLVRPSITDLSGKPVVGIRVSNSRMDRISRYELRPSATIARLSQVEAGFVKCGKTKTRSGSISSDMGSLRTNEMPSLSNGRNLRFIEYPIDHYSHETVDT